MDVEDARKAAAGLGRRPHVGVLEGRPDRLRRAPPLRRGELVSRRRDAFAERAFGKLVPALKKLGKPAISDATTICFDRKELGPLLFARKGRELVMINGPARVASGAWTVDEHVRDREEVGRRDRRADT